LVINWIKSAFRVILIFSAAHVPILFDGFQVACSCSTHW